MQKWKSGCSYRDAEGKTHTKRLYSIWSNMVARCTKPENKDYKWYGARGITVCDEWLSYDNFYEWAMSTGYADELTLDRSENDEGYSPENCRWVDMRTQCRNRSTTVQVDGVSLKEYAERAQIDYNVAKYRKRNGIDLTAPKLKNPRVCEGMTLKEISVKYGIKFSTLSGRWKTGARTIEELTKPLSNKGRYERGAK